MNPYKKFTPIIISSLILIFSFTSHLTIAQTCSQNLSLKWSTFQGGNGAEEVVDIHVDPTTDQIYTIARTTSTSLIATNGDLGQGGVDKTYVQCMNNNGTLIWSTIISDWKTPHNIYVDDDGNVILFGHTAHDHLPMSGDGLDKVFNGSSDMVYFKLDPSGASILASSYIGGNGYEHINGLNTNIDFYNDNIYGVVSTSSTDITSALNALSSTVGQAFIFSYNYNSENYDYTSYYDYSASHFNTDFEKNWGTESLTVDDNGNVYLMLWNAGNDYTLTANYITSNAIIPDYTMSAFNFPPLIIALDNSYNQSYGSYISNIIDNGIPGGQYNTSIVNGTPGTHNWFGFDINIDDEGSIYILQNAAGFRGPIHVDISGALSTPVYIGPYPFYSNQNGDPQFQIGTNIIKMSANSLSNYQVDYVHQVAYGNGGNPNKYKFEIDKNQQVNLIETTSFYPFGLYQGMQSVNYSPPFVESTGLTSFTIFEKESDEIIYHIRPSEDPFLDFNNPNLNTGRLYDIHLSNDDIYLFGKTASSSYPTTPSYRDQELAQQVFTQQPNYASGDSDGFITVLHSALPHDNNAIADFDLSTNTFCADSYIHQNYGPIDGSAVEWLSGDGSQSNHVVPDIKKGTTIINHPIQFNGSFIQWQKSYDNINWTDIPGAKQEDYSPAPEAQSATVYYRRVFNSCSSAVESNVATAIISGSNDMIVDVGPAPYQHCTLSATPLTITATGGSGDFSWQWFNGYGATTDIIPSTGSSTTGITAEVASAVDGGGVYRIVVTDNNTGCEIEALVTVRDPSVTLDQQYYLCPGQATCVDIGPSFSDPDITYQWTGPNGFTSNLASICVTDVGIYTLTLNGCPSTSVNTELIENAHDPNLTTIPDYTFCQLDAATTIGMSTTAPAGYTFQWAPTQNVSDITAFNPTYNPLIELPSNPQNYTFTAHRESDGCVFEQNLDITLHKHVDVNGIASSSFCSGSDNLYLIDFDGNYVEWEIVATTFPGGLTALQSDPLFSFDGASQLTSSMLSPLITYPQLPSNEYTITFDVAGSSIPFPNTCFDSDIVELTIYESCGNGPNCTSCPPSSCNWSVNANLPPGSDGLCSGVNQLVTLGPSGTANTYEWSIISIDDTPTSSSPLIGIFSETGTLLVGPGPHPNTVIMDIDNPSPGAYDNISYQMTTTSISGIVCKDTLKVYSSAIYGPVVDLIPEFTTCDLGTSSSILQTGTSIPLTINGLFYNSAPNTNIDWTWQGAPVQYGNTPFPTITNTNSHTYTAIATDILSGCRNFDQIEIIVSDVSDGAGPDITDVCSGSIVQIPGPADNPLHTYDWDPPVGLNFPIGTPNNLVSSPYATVDQDINYILTTTAPGCSTEDLMAITTSTAPPPNHPDQNYNACIGDVIQVALDPTFIQNCAGCAYSWSHVSGGNLNYLNSTNNAQPVISVPVSQVNSSIQFQLETTKGNCGSDIMFVTIDVSIPNSPQIPQTLSIDCGLPLSSIIVANHASGNEYEWSSINGLYEDANMSIPLTNNITNLSTVYAYTNTNQTFNVSTIINGCYSAPSSISVINNSPLVANAGDDKDFCFGTNSVPLGPATNPYTNSTTFAWTPTGINSDPYANAFTQPTAAEEADMSSWLSNTTLLNPTLQQGAFIVGSYEYTLTIQDGNCTDTDVMIVRVLDDSFPSGFAGQSQNKCIDDCFYLLDNPNPNYSYTWTPFPSSEAANMTFSYSNNPLVCPQTDVTYTVYLTENSTGCISHTESVSFTLFPSVDIDDVLIEVCQTNISVDLTSYISGYSNIINPTWMINDGSGTIISNPSNYLVTSDIEFILSGENQFGCSEEGIITIQSTTLAPNSDSFYKIIGDLEDNISKRVKFFDDHIYLSYDHYINGFPHASMIKYDRLGNLIWHTTMDYISSLNDFVQDEDCQILAVGYKEPFSNTVDNESLILRFNSHNGTVLNSTTLNNFGREEMKKIIRKRVGSTNSYYITGTRNPSSTPSSIDMTSLYHYRLNGTFSFNNFYTNDLAQLDEEGDRGLLELSDGNVLIFGNDGPTGKGLIMKINGTTGNFIDGLFTDDNIDFYDAVETDNGDILFVGEKFDDNEGCIVVTDNSLNILSSVNFDNITNFREINQTTNTNFLIAGKAKNTEGYPVLFSIDYINGNISANTGYYINSFETDYNTFWFDYDELNNKVAYSDTRTDNPNGFGMQDVLVGIFDLNLTTTCSQGYVPSVSIDNVSKTTESFNKYLFGLIINTASNTVAIPIQEKSNVCGCEDNAINFDGINDYLERSGISLSGDFTISVWFKNNPTSTGSAEDRILTLGNPSRLEIGIERGGPNDGELWVYDPQNSVYTSGDFVRDGMWHHVILTKNSGLTELYLDNNLAGSFTVSASNTYGPTMRLGNWVGNGSHSLFDGDIDEVSIWDIGMTSSTISEISNCTLTGSEANLVAYYNMNIGITGGDNTGISVIPDISGNGNDLSFLNFDLTGPTSNLVCSTTGLSNDCNICTDTPIALCDSNITLTVDTANPTATVNVSDIDNGSSSNCGAVTLSFDANSIVTTLDFDCPVDLGEQLVTLYVTDPTGLQSSCTTTIDISSSNQELAALQDFYDAAGGDNWINTTAGDRPWFEDCDPCGINDGTPWFGIECTILNTVDQIWLNSNNLNGQISPSIGTLTDLEWFLAGNNPLLGGSLPAEFCLTKLLHFGVSDNNLVGAIPPCFITIPNLVRFIVSDNDLIGQLPSFGQDVQYPQPLLKIIQVKNNQLTGSIPNSLTMLSALEYLNVSENNLSDCYENTLLGLCNNPLITTNENQYISDGNNFAADWEDFCATGAGQCCEPDITLDGSLISSGIYEASNSITIVGCLPASLDITLNAPTVIMDPSFKVELGAVVTTQMIGCP